MIIVISAVLAAAQPAAVPAPASPMQHEMHGQAGQPPSGMHKDCCHDCCKDMADKDEGHEAGHSGHNGQ